MVKINLIDMMLPQPPITPEKIQAMLTSPRRRRIEPEWDGLKEPSMEGGDWLLRVPFEPYRRAFDEVFWLKKINNIGWREGSNHTYYTYLKDVDEEDLQEIKAWQLKMRGWVAIRDCLPISLKVSV